MQMRKVAFVIIGCAAIAIWMAPTIAFALISIAPGVYEVPALVVPGKEGPVAVFNLRTRSQCRIRLRGAEAEKLTLDTAKGLKVKFRVQKRIAGSHGEAELLEAKALGEAAIPILVGNDLKPADQHASTK